ncbi:putative ATP-grasp-modified RiPP [Streptomyces sp. NPDC051105]|uniref:putative ATP-grasp-modified RiPP n=1 Tax=Streptomyces sp. NPDC051105 TaxID=3154843 RepID=UPI0034446598
MTVLDVREVFPHAPEGGRIPYSADPPTGPDSRPWVLRFARVPDAAQADVLPATVYDEEQQVSIGVYDGDPLYLGKTHSPTVPDGNMKKPPPLDEGTKD